MSADGDLIWMLPVGLEDDLSPREDSQDTINLRQAIASLSDGGIIRILPGTVHVSSTIMAYDFVGEIIGAGAFDSDDEQTTVIARGPWDEDVNMHVFPEPPLLPGGERTEAYVFWFLPSAAENPVDVRLSDLHITAVGGSVVTAGPPARIAARALGGAVLATGPVTSEQPNWPAPYEVASVNVNLEDVFIEGQVCDEGTEQDCVIDPQTNEPMSNFLDGFLMQGGGDRLNADGQHVFMLDEGFVPITGQVTVSGSRFEELLRAGVWIQGLVSPGFNAESIEVDPWSYPLDRGRSAAHLLDNELHRVGYWGHWIGLFFFDCYDADLWVTGNTLTESGGYSISYGGGYSREALGSRWHPSPGPGEAAQLHILDNHIQIVTGFGHAFPELGNIDWPAVGVGNFFGIGTQPVEARIVANDVVVEGLGLAWAAIDSGGVDGVLVMDNTVTTIGDEVAVEIGIAIEGSTGAQVIGNDLTGIAASSGFHYWLASDTSDIFLCDPHEDMVVNDEGTNNTIMLGEDDPEAWCN